jgi:hypothetical protein
MNFTIKKMSLSMAAIIFVGIASSVYAAPGSASVGAASSAALTSNLAESNSKVENNGMNLTYDYSLFTMDFTKMATLPSYTVTSPSGMVPSWGVVFGSVSGMTNAPGSNKSDGAAAVGFGFGDSQKSIGGALTLGVGSINSDGGQLNRGNIGISVGHLFTETLTSVAIGAQNIAGWNAGEGNQDASLYAAVTQILANDFVPVILNAGIGNNGYFFLRSNESRTTNIAPFVSASFYVLPQVSLIADYTQGVTSASVSLVPIASIPVTVNLGAWDLFQYAPDHNDVSFMGSVSYAYSF